MLYVAKASKDPESVRGHVNRVVNVFIAAAPTGAPTVVVAALAYCILHLRSQDLQVLLPEKIKTIADVELVCFDKTGTLTGTTVSSCQSSGACLPFRLPIRQMRPAYCAHMVPFRLPVWPNDPSHHATILPFSLPVGRMNPPPMVLWCLSVCLFLMAGDKRYFCCIAARSSRLLLAQLA